MRVMYPEGHATHISVDGPSQGLETDFPTGASPEEFAKFMMEEREDFMRLAKVAELEAERDEARAEASGRCGAGGVARRRARTRGRALQDRGWREASGGVP